MKFKHAEVGQLWKIVDTSGNNIINFLLIVETIQRAAWTDHLLLLDTGRVFSSSLYLKEYQRIT